MRLRKLIEKLQKVEKSSGDVEVELVTGHRTDEYELRMDDTGSVELISDEQDLPFVRIRACEEKSWY